MPRSTRSRFLVLLALLSLLLTTGLMAQRREIRGRVTDSGGAPVRGVTAELVLDGEVQRTATSDQDGFFGFDPVDFARGRFEIRLSITSEVIGSVRMSLDTPRSTTIFGKYSVEVRHHSLATAARPSPPPPPPPQPLPDEKHAIVPVFYATDRERVRDEPLNYNTRRSPDEVLHLGRFDVSIPRDPHQVGRIERPNIWTFYREDPDKHFVIVGRHEETYDGFYQDLRRVVGTSARKEAFVFVHGFNVGFEDAVYRTAQISYDLGFDGAPILYSWPSIGTLATYAGDVNNSTWTALHLQWFLEDVAAKSGAQYVHLIAHSMGNQPLIRALNQIATRPRSTPRPRFRQIILTAPDIDVGLFRQLAGAMVTVGDRVTLYASSNDKALKLSEQYQGGYQRAGDTLPSIVTLSGIDSIDVSAVDTDLIGHFYYGDNRSVLSDIFRLISRGLPPNERCGLRPGGDAATRWWQFVAATICPLE